MQQPSPVKTIGLPRMHKEAGERRDFLPALVRFLASLGPERIVIERGYGSQMGFSEADYASLSQAVRFTSLPECFAQDVVIVLRWPDEELVRSMRPGSILVTMAHFPTRPGRVALLKQLGVRCVSLDCVKDDLGRRLVENLRAVGWNGVRAAFGELRTLMPGFDSARQSPVRVTLMGAGAVGAHAVQAATRYGDPALREQLSQRSVPGVEVTAIDYDLTCHEEYMLTRLGQTDLLIDATQRPDASQVIIPNDWVAALPQHAVMLDLCVDPYLMDQSPPQVKGIEAVPEGNLDQYVFGPDDPGWDRLPPQVVRKQRRTALSCYSWPGVDPLACMQVYGQQIKPVLRVVTAGGVDNLDPERGTDEERAVARAELRHHH